MDITPRSFADLSAADVTFGSCPLPSKHYCEALVVAFAGEAGNSHECCGTFAFMKAMIAAGVAAWEPVAVVLDLRRLTYEWGDNMLDVLSIVDDSRPLAIVVSDLNREGLTSLVAQEMLAQPGDWLFESVEGAVAATDRAFVAQQRA
jgi:hypothetical protein